ncbi:receptor-type tyrosine-protein phosphatase eta-like, partial [Mercenaria mercenaria]|uniref:receptor-type tyrosine-protein phosphatase eta-like n=1 Tax=Mercenaria mercenaria TaxID=6596 RepID=UPI00234E80B4
LNVNLAGLNFKLKTIGTNDIILCWRINPDNFVGSDYFSYVFVDVYSQSDDEYVTTLNESRTAKKEEYDLSVNNLTSGTNYTFIYYVKSENGIPSKDKKQSSSYTRPLPPPHAASISKVTRHSFAIRWKDDQSLRYSSYNIVISPVLASLNVTCDDLDLEKGNCSLQRKANVTALVFDGLAPGNLYSVTIYTSIAGLYSESGLHNSTYTIPLLPNKVFIPEDNISNSSLYVQYEDPASNFTHWSLTISNKHIPYTMTMMVPMNVSSVHFHYLQPGTEYSITVQTSVPGFYSINKTTLKTFTRPSDLQSIDIPKEMVHASNFTVNYGVWDDMYNYIQFTICNVSCITETQTKGILKKTIYSLTAATFYKIEAFAVKNTSQNVLKSKNPGTGASFSAPERPTSFRDTVESKSVTIDLSGNSHLLFDYYKIQYNNKTERLLNRTEGRAVLSELTPGTEYTFEVYTVLTGIMSDGFSTITTFTLPLLPNKVFIPEDNISNNSLNVQYEDPASNFTQWVLQIFYISTEEQIINTKMVPMNVSSVQFDNLQPGTEYSITVLTSVPGFYSSNKTTLRTFTRPEPLVDAERSIASISVDNIRVLLAPNSSKHCDKYLLQISPRPEIGKDTFEIFRNASDLSHTFKNLNASTQYNITITNHTAQFAQPDTKLY